MNRTVRQVVVAVCGLLAPLASAQAPDSAYQKSFDQWKSELVDDLKENWLSLVGLFWLKPGENTFGTDASNSVVFPKGSPRAGAFVRAGNDVTLKLLPGVHATIAGKLGTSAKLDPDTTGHPTIVEMGSLRFHVIVRGQRIGIRLKDLENPAAQKYQGPVFFPINLNYRVTAEWLPSDGKKTVEVPNVLGDVAATKVAGTAVFKINGQEMSLTDMGGDPGKGLFFVFNDLTARTDTYPGGRFLQTGPVMKGVVVLDFNRAYNPPCAVTPYATCPLAPKENRLPAPIPAGEKYDHAHGHH